MPTIIASNREKYMFRNANSLASAVQAGLLFLG